MQRNHKKHSCRTIPNAQETTFRHMWYFNPIKNKIYIHMYLMHSYIYTYCHLWYNKYKIQMLTYSLSQKNRDSTKNMFLLKNQQFLPNHYETSSKWGYLILAKFRFDWVKIVDFLIKSYFWVCPDTPGTLCTVFTKKSLF